MGNEEMKMEIVPTLNFAGGCREAIHLYEKAFWRENLLPAFLSGN